MYRRDDPRLRRTLNQLSQNLESANESAQAGLYNFTQNYIDPCLASISHCFHSLVVTCLPDRDERLRRNRGRSWGRAEPNFDFYDDWENDENDGLLGWGNDELDRLLAGASGYGTTSQPARERGMSYGIRRDGRAARRKSAVQPHDGGPDPTIIPSSSYFGFLGRLPWKIGSKGLRYKPSAADLREHPGLHRVGPETEPLMEDSDGTEEDAQQRIRKQTRKRSETAGSGHTTDSLSSRGDIFPSEDEIDDAVPLDDEFATALERRATGLGDEGSSGHTSSGKRVSLSRLSTRSVSSRSITLGKRARGNSITAAIEEVPVPTLADLKQEEERVEIEEEADVKHRREAAQRIAIDRGLSSPVHDTQTSTATIPPRLISTSPKRYKITETSATPYSNLAIKCNSDMVPFPVFEPHSLNSPSHDMGDMQSQGCTTLENTSETVDLNEEPLPTEFVPAKLPNFTT